MMFSYFTENSKNFSENFEPRSNSLEVWKDLLTYSSNLSGNWYLSQQIFYNSIVPTAEKDPVKFAKWIKDMVKKSGIKIKSQSEFREAIIYLKKIKGKNDKNEIKKALYYLMESGLEQPIYALKALRNNSA